MDRDDDAWIGSLLSSEADQHPLDTARLVARVMAEVNRPETDRPELDGTEIDITGVRLELVHSAAEPVGRARGRDRRPGGPQSAGRRSRVLPAGLAAAALATIATVGSLLPGVGHHGLTDHVGTAGNASTPTSSSTQPHATPRPSLPSALGTAATAPPSKRSQATAQAAIEAVPPGAVVVSAQRTSQGTVVRLPGAGDLDWVAVAGGSGGTPIRAGDGGHRIVGPEPYGSATAQASAGPFALSPAGPASPGSTSQQGSSTRTWQTLTGTGTGLRITAPVGASTGALVLYLGAIGGNAHVTARLDGGGHGQSVNLAPSADGAGYVLTIRFRTVQGGDTVLVDVSADPGAGIGLAAIELR